MVAPLTAETHARWCSGGCPRWLATGAPSCMPYPCQCAKTRADGPEWAREYGADACWWRHAVTGRTSSRCACWRRDDPEGMPPDCCAHVRIEEPAGLPPQAVRITLSAQEMAAAFHKTLARRRSGNGRWEGNTFARTAREQERDDLRGPIGEVALCRYLGLPFTMQDIDTYQKVAQVGRDEDGTGLDVRTIGDPKRFLIGRSTDRRPLVLALVDLPEDGEAATVQLLGWATREECADPMRGKRQRWGSTEQRKSGEAWALAQAFLHPMRELPGAPAWTSVGGDESVADDDPGIEPIGSGVSDWTDDAPWVDEGPPRREPYVRRWPPEELTCPCPTPWDAKKGPGAGVHCTTCHSDFTNPGAAAMHRRRWTDPCLPPEGIVDVDTGAALLRLSMDGVWSIDWAANVR